MNIWEIIEYGKYNLISEWSPLEDIFKTHLEKSHLLEQIAVKKGISKEDLLAEIKRRENALNDIIKSGKRSQKDVTQSVIEYYTNKRKEKREEKPRKVEPWLMAQYEATPKP